MRGTQSADINKMMRLWNDVMKNINTIHGNNRDVKEVKKKWNNLKVSAKARLDCSRRGSEDERKAELSRGGRRRIHPDPKLG